MKPEIDIDVLMADRKAFDAFLYTPIEQAVLELQKRAKIVSARDFVEIPKHLVGGMKAVTHRQVVSPTCDIQHFIDSANMIDCEPIYLSYHEDKFATLNATKLHLGKLLFYGQKGRNGGQNIKKVIVVDFLKTDGKPISSINTLWGQSLIDFHRELFLAKYPTTTLNIVDYSNWYKKHGPNPRDYYFPLLLSLVRHGILFENFLLSGKEAAFTKSIVLPAFIEVIKVTGMKPLIVPMVPTDIESDRFWYSYPCECQPVVERKLNTTNEHVSFFCDSTNQNNPRQHLSGIIL